MNMWATLLTLWRLIDRALDVVIWLNERTMLYIALALLAPLMAIVTVSILFFDVRPMLRPYYGDAGQAILIGWPIWLAFCALTERSAHPLADMFRDWLPRAPIILGFALFAVGGLLWWHGSPPPMQ